MKIIKSFILIAAGICTVNLLHAQKVKSQLAEETAAKIPSVTTITSKPSPSPELKPMNGAELKQAPATAAETASPMTKNTDNKPQQPKPLATVAPVAITDVPVEKSVTGPVPTPVVIKEQ